MRILNLFYKWETYFKNLLENKNYNSNNNLDKTTPGNNINSSNITSNVIGGSQGSNPTPLPNMGGQFVVRRKKVNQNNNNNSNKKKDDKKIKVKK